MDIISVIKSGKRYKRRGSTLWMYPGCSYTYFPEDFLANDWEVEEEKIEITEEMLRDAQIVVSGYYVSDLFNKLKEMGK